MWCVSILQEKVVTFVLRQEEGSEHISKAALLQFLQHEYEVRAVNVAAAAAAPCLCLCHIQNRYTYTHTPFASLP